jgi:hypothetical protein
MTAQPWNAGFRPQKRPIFQCDCGATKEKEKGKWVCKSPGHGEKVAELQSQNRKQQTSQQVDAIKSKALSGVPK